jgi:hypothetical protein
MTRLRCNQIDYCYLTDEAQLAIEEMVKQGMDPDLARAVLEQLWAVDEIYNLDCLEEEELSDDC